MCVSSTEDWKIVLYVEKQLTHLTCLEICGLLHLAFPFLHKV